MLNAKTISLRLAVCVFLMLSGLTGCGAGADSALSPQATVSALRLQAAALAAEPEIAPDEAARQLMDFGEARYSVFFPGHPATQSFGPFVFRFYPETGIYLGVVISAGSGFVQNGVYVMGGAFGSAPYFVGPLADIITPANTLAEVKAFLASTDALWTSLPTTGASATQLNDGCYLSNGESNAYQIAQYDTDPTVRQSQAFRVGSVRSNVQIMAERRSTNSDASARHEVDVKYDISFTDGTAAVGAIDTLVTGSTFGACSTPTSNSSWRTLGNQRRVSVSLQPRNSVSFIHSIATGAEIAPFETTRRDVRFSVRDPANVATYAVISGPAPLTGGSSFSAKLLSPRILRDDPLMAGKVGNANWRDIDRFQFCSTSSNALPAAAAADCANPGAVFDHWGWTMSANLRDPAAVSTADNAFAAQGWVAGGLYMFQIFADDGWKTVNGQAGKTPIGTYTVQLNRLPYTFAQMNASPASYPDLSGLSLTTAQIAAAFTGSGGTLTLNGIVAAAPAGGRAVALNDIFVFGQGPNQGATNGWPRTRENDLFYPGSTSTSATVTIKGKNPATSAKTFAQIGIQYTDRNSGLSILNITFQ